MYTKLQLGERTEAHVRIFWQRVQDQEIQRMFPATIKSLQQALTLFAQTLRENADSFGRVIYLDEKYVGDVWCYSIDRQQKTAMLSIVIFTKEHWGKGIAAWAMREFIQEVHERYGLERLGAFTYASNRRSISLLEKVGFLEMDFFVQNGIESKYFELRISGDGLIQS